MNDLFYLELREKIREIRKYEQTGAPDEIKEWRKQAVEMSIVLFQLSMDVRKEGLLAAEELADALAASMPFGEDLKELAGLVVDGTEPAVIEEIGMQRYFVEDMKEYKGLIYLLLIRGMLEIAQGENPLIMRKKLQTMLPAELDEIYAQREQEREEQEKEKERKQYELAIRKVSEVCQGTYTGEIKGGGGIPVKRLDYVISKISDRDLQRLLREVDNLELKVVLKGLGREAREHVFQNMSKRLAGMIAGEMISEGCSEVWEVIRACLGILGIWEQLVEGEEVIDV